MRRHLIFYDTGDVSLEAMEEDYDSPASILINQDESGKHNIASNMVAFR
ncbi:MAG: hypothetical protein ACK2T3_00965 [Candidatus Promineifilaceae bacterium]